MNLLLVWILVNLHEIQEPPRIITADRQSMVLRLDGAFLEDQEVQNNLKSGLTTTLEIRAKVFGTGGETANSAALIEIRYELWDEVFLLRKLDHQHSFAESKLPSLERLAIWLEQTDLWFSFDRKFVRGKPASVQVSLRVIPFSEREQNQTRRWVNQSINSPTTGSTGNRVLALIVGTSIKRASLLTFQWRLNVPKEPNR